MKKKRKVKFRPMLMKASRSVCIGGRVIVHNGDIIKVKKVIRESLTQVRMYIVNYEKRKFKVYRSFIRKHFILLKYLKE